MAIRAGFFDGQALVLVQREDEEAKDRRFRDSALAGGDFQGIGI
jgi:hypothetical protein